MRFSMIAASFLVSLALAAPIQERKTSAEKAAESAAAVCPAAATSAAAESAAATSAAATTAAATSAAATAAATSEAAAAATTAASASTGGALVSSAYNDFQISGGSAGTGEADANALFTSVDTSNLAGVSAADLKVIKGIHDAAEDAEVGAFNPAIAAASGDALAALKAGKTKNKILKLTAEVLSLQIETAQGADKAADVTKEQAKLANNIKTDTAAAGSPSTAIPFDASS